MRVLVAGLGKVGYPTAEYVAQKGLTAYGYDLRRRRSDSFQVFQSWNEIPDFDAALICVSTSANDQSNVEDVVRRIANSKALVSIESTVPVGTCRRLAESYGLRSLVHVPHRLWVKDLIHHGVKEKRVIGALNKKSMNLGVNLYSNRLEIPLHKVSMLEVAELCKVGENGYRYCQIAFAEYLKLLCQHLHLPFKDVHDACNTKWNIQIPEARSGIGGECLPMAMEILEGLSPIGLPEELMKLDAKYRKRYGVRSLGKSSCSSST